MAVETYLPGDCRVKIAKALQYDCRPVYRVAGCCGNPCVLHTVLADV